jgi:hypothetical protein
MNINQLTVWTIFAEVSLLLGKQIHDLGVEALHYFDRNFLFAN